MPFHLGHRQHHRHLAGVLGADQPSREIGAIERVREEEPQRGDDAVHRCCRDASLLLLDLELADIFRARGVGRAPQPGNKAPRSDREPR